jgi:methionine synthase II (cobalamin-independent)
MAGKLHSAPPFKAEHMGSLLRPENLLEVRATIRDKGVSEEEAGLPAVEKAAVGEVIKMQQELGFKAVTDGEYVRTRFWGLMVRRLWPRGSRRVFRRVLVYMYCEYRKDACKDCL